VISLVLTTIVRGVAPRIGLVDHPDSTRKLHRKPTPLGGGIAVFLATAGVLGVTLVGPDPWGLELSEAWPDVVTLLFACMGIFVLGLVDDCWGLRGRHKLLGQAILASVLAGGGLLIERVDAFGWQIELGLLAFPFTLFWLVGATNAVNLLDGIDGLATVLGIILSGTIAVMAMISGHPAVSLVAWVFTGSLLGFLPFNLPPASVFLGDAGSMLIGLVVGVLAVRGSLKGAGTVLLAAPLALWTIPILDSAAAILRRKLTGRSIYATDRGHLHHRLLKKLGSNQKVLVCVGVCCVLTSIAALASVFLKNDLIAIAGCLAVILILITTNLFGRGEVSLLMSRLHDISSSFIRPFTPGRAKGYKNRVVLGSSGRWASLWAELTASANEFGLHNIQLDLNIPAMQEEFSATWERRSLDDLDRCWRMELPLVIAEQPVGRLTVTGGRDGPSMYEDIEHLRDLVVAFENELLALTEAQERGDRASAAVGAISLAGDRQNLEASALTRRLPR
jgi:UDP-GlcNAc:undecaprenyl-phosphate GlcNAc-1-phosphate transferase